MAGHYVSVEVKLSVEVKVRDRRGVDMIPRQGGWLCDEMGMGKTAVVTALVLARPSTTKPRDDAMQLRLKATLVVCNNTLVQQWEDEVKKFAPNLRVETFYSNGSAGAAKRKESALRNLKDTDVLIMRSVGQTPLLIPHHGHNICSYAQYSNSNANMNVNYEDNVSLVYCLVHELLQSRNVKA